VNAKKGTSQERVVSNRIFLISVVDYAVWGIILKKYAIREAGRALLRKYSIN
jgi:hypothetical protein